MHTMKYRAYIKPLERYAEKYETILYHHQCNMEPSWTVNISPEEYYGDEELVIEQFTGLLDRNGKEIYEGDWVRAVGEITLNDDIADNPIAEIVWVDSAAAFGEKFTIKEAPMVPLGMYTYEVIGNVHEPPKDFRPEHLKRMGVSICKGGEE